MSDKPRHISILSSTAARPAREITWQPAADVYRTPSGWLLKLELAGVTPDDIQISMAGSAVTISGVRRDHISEQNCCHYSMEISYSRFQRTIHLPCDVSSAALETRYENGILLVRVTV